MRNEQGPLPTDIYLSFVSSLYHNRGMLVIGMLLHVATFLLVFLKTSDAFYLACIVAILFLWVLRNLDMMRFNRSDLSDADDAAVRRWENRYIAGGVAVALTCGAACAYAIAVTRDSFAQLACISVTLASLSPLVGRNFGSERAVLLLSSAACLPMMIAALSLGDPFMAALAFLILPFILSTRMMANNVRSFLSEKVLSARNDNLLSAEQIGTIASQFETALNSMTRGLFMLDRHSRVAVVNERAAELLRLGDKAELKGMPIDDVLERGARGMALDAEKSEYIATQLHLLIAGRRSRTLISIAEDLFLEFAAYPRENGEVVLILEDMTAHVLAERQILYMARFDMLTGLPSRNHFAELVHDAMGVDAAPDRDVGFLLLDVAEFRHVNDTRGHIAGDKLLKAIAVRLKSLAAAETIAARLMGDEFLVFFPNLPGRSDLKERICGLHAELQGTYVADGLRFEMAIDGGFVLVNASDFRFEELQIKADLALSEAKKRGHGGCAAFEEAMEARYLDRQKLKVDLREAVAGRALDLAYQPMFTPDGSRVESCEALARWIHPERGSVPPPVFIQLAEELGLVTELTRLVVAQACRDCLSWPPEVAVSVNLSVLDLRGDEIVGVLTGILKETGLAPDRLHLEITESCLMADPARVQKVLHQLRAGGMTIAIDDFGTGYSSLSYLDSLPVSVIKIDRSFVHDIDEDSRHFKLLLGIVNLARALELKIVAEGVETPKQLQLLRERNCADLIQGFVFAAPMPASAVAALCTHTSQARAASGGSPSADFHENPSQPKSLG